LKKVLKQAGVVYDIKSRDALILPAKIFGIIGLQKSKEQNASIIQ